jgi:hypothetical protein
LLLNLYALKKNNYGKEYAFTNHWIININTPKNDIIKYIYDVLVIYSQTNAKSIKSFLKVKWKEREERVDLI